jgi:hypothetical protein
MRVAIKRQIECKIEHAMAKATNSTGGLATAAMTKMRSGVFKVHAM